MAELKLDPSKATWLQSPALIKVIDAIENAGGEIRVNGGAVRNTLMGIDVGDVDLSTTLLPAQTVKALEVASIRAIPTGFEHGTITAVSDHVPYEITTLREDIETDGRHAVVLFGTDWKRDAKRRDLTINALYCDRNGVIFDPLDGLADIQSRTVRFIGNAVDRIGEDYLRILRFFRFFAWYGEGRPDGEGLKACAKLKSGLEKISVERIWAELQKLLAAPDPSRALLWMRTTGVLSLILPESEKWGIDLIPHLITAERQGEWEPDPVLRLEAMIRPDSESVTRLARRLRLSNTQGARLTSWSMAETPGETTSETELQQTLYAGNREAISDRLKLEIAGRIANNTESDEVAGKLAKHLALVTEWERPIFPVKGEDLLKRGYQAGPEIGKRLRELERTWIESGFKLDSDALLAKT